MSRQDKWFLLWRARYRLCKLRNKKYAEQVRALGAYISIEYATKEYYRLFPKYKRLLIFFLINAVFYNTPLTLRGKHGTTFDSTSRVI